MILHNILALLFILVLVNPIIGGPLSQDEEREILDELAEELAEKLMKEKRADASNGDCSLVSDKHECLYKKLNINTYSDCATPTLDKDLLDADYCKSASDETHSIDGKCNNEKNPAQGATHTRLRRICGDTSYKGREIPVGYVLPNIGSFDSNNPSNTDIDYVSIATDTNVARSAQEISDIVFRSKSVDKPDNSRKVSHLFMVFGQFLDHVFALTEPSECHCEEPKCKKHGEFAYPCFPILKRKDSDLDCRDFTRSKADCTSQSENKRQHLNDLSPFFDASTVYGSTYSKLAELRGENGYMLVSNGDLLPFHVSTEEPCKHTGGCFNAGDIRVNEMPSLTSMHTIWIRLHNYIVDFLPTSWSSDERFCTARKIVIAIYQQTIYEEWLPNVAKIDDYKGYDKNVDPSCRSEFTTAAFRFGHSLINNRFERLGADYNFIANPYFLQEAFFNTGTILGHDCKGVQCGIEPIVHGLLSNRSNIVDREFAEGIAEKLFIDVGSSLTQNLLARNLQRGRDHGLCSYQKTYQELFNEQFDENELFESDVLADLKEAYDFQSDHIDLFAAGISEKPHGDLLVGKTFSKIIGDQFQRARDGDRFFYQNKNILTEEQLKVLKPIKERNVLCVTLHGVVSVQEHAFQAYDEETNPRKVCPPKGLEPIRMLALLFAKEKPVKCKTNE